MLQWKDPRSKTGTGHRASLSMMGRTTLAVILGLIRRSGKSYMNLYYIYVSIWDFSGDFDLRSKC